MSSYLLDTHTWAWALLRSRKLSKTVIAAMRNADEVFVSPISIYQNIQKVRIGKWLEMEPFLVELLPALARQRAVAARLDAEICFRAAFLDWINKDPFDRMIVATALVCRIPFISADTSFDGVITRIW